MLRSLRYITEIFAALVGIAIICALLLAWRLSSTPVSPNFLAPYIKSGIESVIPGSQAHVESLLLSWDNVERALAIHAKGVTINNAKNNEIANIPVFNAKISLLGLLFGQLLPKELVIDHPQVKLDRNENGTLIFGGIPIGGNEQDKARISPANKIVGNIAEHLSEATFTQKLVVTRAVFDIHDAITQKNWSISVPEISIKRNGLRNFDRALRYGTLSGRIKVEVPQATDSALNINYAYDPAIQQHKLISAFSNINPSLITGENPGASGFGSASLIDLPLTGKAELIFDDNLKLLKISAQIHGDEGRLVNPDFWDNPCPVKRLDIDALYNRVTRKLTVSGAHIDFNGPSLDIKAEGLPPSPESRALDFTAELKIEKLPMDRFSEIWPKPVLPNPRYWLTSNLHKGTFDRAEMTLKGAISPTNLADISIAEGTGKIVASGGQIIYIEGMPPVENVGAEATFDLKKMDVEIKSGGIGNIHLSPFTLQITGLAEIDQYIDIPLKVAGPVPEVLQLLDHPPLMYARALGISPNDMNGKIEGTVSFQFPLLKNLEMKNVVIHAAANATGVASTKLIPGIPIDQGNLALDLDTAGLNLKGRAALGKSPFQITWQEKFEQKTGVPLRQIKATGTILDDRWNNLGITAFNGTKGAIKVSLEVIKPVKTKTLYTGVLNMTPAAVVVGMLNWQKPADVPAILKFSAEDVSGNPITVSPIELSGTGVSAKGSAVLSPDLSQIVSLDFSPFIVGRTDAALKLTQATGEGGKRRFEAKGVSLDISGLGSSPSSQEPASAKEYLLQVDHLYTAENGQIDKMEGSASRDKSGWQEINFQGLADGDTPLSIELTPKPDGTRTFKFVCANFGKAMKGLGFTDTIKDGKVSVLGQSTIEDPQTIKGKAKITKFTVSKLPVLALLLNATSPFGFSGLLTDSADFSRFEGDFIWVGDEITLTRAHASGSSVGINIDGKVDINTSNANLQGTLVPFSAVNDVLNHIPFIGDLITGGKDQGVLAVTYEINGNLNKPKVSVNPVSLLAPGFIRNLFFSDDEEEETENDEPKD